MSTWNYRVERLEYGLDKYGNPMEVYDIIEVYYDDDGRITGWGSVAPVGESVESLAAELSLMLDATTKPVLDGLTDIPDRE